MPQGRMCRHCRTNGGYHQPWCPTVLPWWATSAWGFRSRREAWGILIGLAVAIAIVLAWVYWN